MHFARSLLFPNHSTLINRTRRLSTHTRSSEIVAAAQKFGETLDAGPAARSAFIARQIDTLAKQVAAEEARLAEAKAACADAEQNARTCEAAAAAVVAHNDRCVAESAKLDEFMASVDQKLVRPLKSALARHHSHLSATPQLHEAHETFVIPLIRQAASLVIEPTDCFLTARPGPRRLAASWRWSKSPRT